MSLTSQSHPFGEYRKRTLHHKADRRANSGQCYWKVELGLFVLAGAGRDRPAVSSWNSNQGLDSRILKESFRYLGIYNRKSLINIRPRAKSSLYIGWQTYIPSPQRLISISSKCYQLVFSARAPPLPNLCIVVMSLSPRDASVISLMQVQSRFLKPVLSLLVAVHQT